MPCAHVSLARVWFAGALTLLPGCPATEEPCDFEFTITEVTLAPGEVTLLSARHLSEVTPPTSAASGSAVVVSVAYDSFNDDDSYLVNVSCAGSGPGTVTLTGPSCAATLDVQCVGSPRCVLTSTPSELTLDVGATSSVAIAASGEERVVDVSAFADQPDVLTVGAPLATPDGWLVPLTCTGPGSTRATVLSVAGDCSVVVPVACREGPVECTLEGTYDADLVFDAGACAAPFSDSGTLVLGGDGTATYTGTAVRSASGTWDADTCELDAAAAGDTLHLTCRGRTCTGELVNAGDGCTYAATATLRDHVNDTTLATTPRCGAQADLARLSGVVHDQSELLASGDVATLAGTSIEVRSGGALTTVLGSAIVPAEVAEPRLSRITDAPGQVVVSSALPSADGDESYWLDVSDPSAPELFPVGGLTLAGLRLFAAGADDSSAFVGVASSAGLQLAPLSIGASIEAGAFAAVALPDVVAMTFAGGVLVVAQDAGATIHLTSVSASGEILDALDIAARGATSCLVSGGERVALCEADGTEGVVHVVDVRAGGGLVETTRARRRPAPAWDAAFLPGLLVASYGDGGNRMIGFVDLATGTQTGAWPSRLTPRDLSLTAAGDVLVTAGDGTQTELTVITPSGCEPVGG